MRLALIGDYRPAIVTPAGVVDVSDFAREILLLPPEYRTPALIEGWSRYAPAFQEAASRRPALNPAEIRFRAPLPRPAKLLCGQLSFREGIADAVVTPAFFLKSTTSVIGPGDTVELPAVDASVFHHEAELAVVIGKRAKSVMPAQAMDHVFGYTCFMDMSARGVGPGTGYQDKSYDTFGPMGPWILTADEIDDPHALQVRLWNDGEIRHDYPMSDIGNPIPIMIAYASSIAALEPGDVLAMGVNHQGIGPIQDGENLRIEISPIGGFEVRVIDNLNRRWEKGIDRGVAEAVLRLVRGEPLGQFQFARRIDGRGEARESADG